jgi:hypothetical protein
MYYAIVQHHLVLLYTGTYHLVMRLTILANSGFRFGTRYTQPLTLSSARYSLCEQCIKSKTQIR